MVLLEDYQYLKERACVIHAIEREFHENEIFLQPVRESVFLQFTLNRCRNLHDNLLWGPLPPELGNLSKLARMYVSYTILFS